MQYNVECLGIERFLKVVERACLDGSYGALDAPLSRKDDKGERGVAFPGLVDQLNAIDIRHDKIGYDQVNGLLSQQGKCFAAIGGADDGITLVQ